MRHGTSSNNSNNNSNRRHRNRNNNGRRNNQPRTQVYDSNGPDVRIRGTAHQVAEKYLTLAKDATSSGDRIVAENYFQHAEHYIRMINENNGRFESNKDSNSEMKQSGNEQENKFSDSSSEKSSKPEDDLALPDSILGSEASIKSTKVVSEEAVD